jgi:hypothetical protein
VTPNDITVICNLLRLGLKHPTEFEGVKERAQAAPMALAVQ